MQKLNQAVIRYGSALKVSNAGLQHYNVLWCARVSRGW